MFRQYNFHIVNRINSFNSSTLILIPIIYVVITRDYISFSENKLSIWNAFLALFAIVGLQYVCYQFHSRLLQYLGKNTLVIMAIHMFLISLSVEYIKPCITNVIIYKLIEQIIIWSTCFTSITIINNYLPWVIGKGAIHGK